MEVELSVEQLWISMNFRVEAARVRDVCKVQYYQLRLSQPIQRSQTFSFSKFSQSASAMQLPYFLTMNVQHP